MGGRRPTAPPVQRVEEPAKIKTGGVFVEEDSDSGESQHVMDQLMVKPNLNKKRKASHRFDASNFDF